MIRSFNLKSFSIIAIFCSLIVACTPTTELRGKVLTERALKTLVIGETTQREALQALGTPTTTSTFDQSVWYYIGQKMERVGIHEEEVVERRVLALTFDENKKLANVSHLSEQDGIEITPSDKETVSSGRKFTVMQQLIGNLGRFNKSDFEGE